MPIEHCLHEILDLVAIAVQILPPTIRENQFPCRQRYQYQVYSINSLTQILTLQNV